MAMDPFKVGVVGCGSISGAYLRNAPGFKAIEVVACADLDAGKARSRAEEFGIRACAPEEVMADPEIGIVLNLTIPKAHFEVAKAALDAGKSVFNEKPFTVRVEEAAELLETARARGLRVGSAPDTFLGAGLQTCRKLIDEGAIGEPVAATAFMMSHGHEGWHPSPEFYYEVGGGPDFDMGPYYVTALVSLLGPVRRATGSARITFPERTITSEPRRGKRITVEVPTHVAGVLDFANGTVATFIMTFDVWAANLPRIEIYGSEGTLAVPDPNGFGGPVRLKAAGGDSWEEVPLAHARNCRSAGLADMAAAISSGRPHRASGELAHHVLDVMHAVREASETGRHVELRSSCARPDPLPPGLAEGEMPE